MSPADCIGFLFGKIKPVAAFQPGVADFPHKVDSTSETITVEDSTVPISVLGPVCAAPDGGAAPSRDAQQSVEDSDAQHVDDQIFVPVNKTSRKRRVVDLAIEMHNRRMATRGAGPSDQAKGELDPAPSVAPESIPVNTKFEVTDRGGPLSTPRGQACGKACTVPTDHHNDQPEMKSSSPTRQTPSQPTIR